jgi:hypothetical protein
MPALGDLPHHALVGQCLVYCMARGIEPTRGGDRSFLLLAICEYAGHFSELNDTQRALIAGFAE